MVIAVRTEESAHGLEVVKEARTDDDAVRLVHEAAMLERARHPGVVHVVAADHRSIRLRHAGTPLALLGPLPLTKIAGLVSCLADIVAAMHRSGVVHRAVTSDHVVVDGHGRPSVCGFGSAADHSDQGAAGDVAAIGVVLSAMLDAAAAGSGGNRAERRRHRDLSAIATQACDPDPARRPTARQLARSIRVGVPDLSLPHPDSTHQDPADRDPISQDTTGAAAPERAAHGHTDPGPTTPGDSVRSRRPRAAGTTRPSAVGERRLAMATAAVVVAIGGTLVGVSIARSIQPFGATDAVAGAPPATTAPPPTATTTETPATRTPATTTPVPTTDSTTTRVQTAAWPAHCPVPDPAGPDVDGDRCPDPVTLDGRLASVGRVQVLVGTDGDLVTLGDWSCDGIHTPAVLRPATGEVFVFPRWHLDAAVEIPAVEVVAGARSISTGDGPCPDPVIRTSDGIVAVAVERAA